MTIFLLQNAEVTHSVNFLSISKWKEIPVSMATKMELTHIFPGWQIICDPLLEPEIGPSIVWCRILLSVWIHFSLWSYGELILLKNMYYFASHFPYHGLVRDATRLKDHRIHLNKLSLDEYNFLITRNKGKSTCFCLQRREVNSFPWGTILPPPFQCIKVMHLTVIHSMRQMLQNKY